nr:uncharacterized protein [Tanacetum cinerariifolium]
MQRIKRKKKLVGISQDYIDHGDPTFECSSCGALLWYAESMRGATNTCFDLYSMCCGRGKVTLMNEVLEPPLLLKELITNKQPKSASFIDNIRRYNSMFAFTSMGGKQDTSVNVGRGPYCYRLHGENYHLAGPLLPVDGKPANNGESFSSRNNKLDYQLTTDIHDLLDEIKLLVQDFRMAGECIRCLDDEKISLRLIGTRQRDGRQYNIPTASEVAALIIGDFESTEHKRDIILHCQDGDFKRISELQPSYLALHYPLFFPYGVGRGLMEWDDLKKVDDVLYPTYRGTCYARGLLQDDKEYIDGILEASLWGMGDYLCYLFVMLIKTDSMCLKDIQNMPYPDQEYTMDGYNRLIYDETSYNKDQLREQHVKLFGSLTTRQKCIYSTIMDAVNNNKGGMFFVYGYGGTEKTYLYKTMSAALHSKGDIVLNVASSGIAALLLEGGRIAHSGFAIPINVVEDSMCHIAADSMCHIAAPVINMHCYEAFDRALRDICRIDSSVAFEKVFKGMVVLFGGIQEFSDWILEIGNGKVGGANDEESIVVFPDNMLIPETDDDVGAIIDDTYPNLLQHLRNPSFFKEKAIIAPTHEMVDIINEQMLSLL